jgi:hypothetical protein
MSRCFASGRYGGTHTGVVDQDVDAPELFSRRTDERLAVQRVGDVSPNSQRVAANRFHQRAGVGEALFAARSEHDVGSRLGQRTGERHAEAAGSAGNNRDPVVESEAVKDGYFGARNHWCIVLINDASVQPIAI